MKKIVYTIATGALLLAACSTQKKSTVQLPAFDAEGHRGCRGIMPENTIPAMLHALDLNITTLEMDAVITKDKQVVLSHEPFFNHHITTRPDGSLVPEAEERNLNIFRMTYEETQRYDVGLKPNPAFPKQRKMAATKPLLSEVIEKVEAAVKQKGRKPVFYNIETKTQPATDNIFHPAPEEFVDLLMGVINKAGIADRVIIQSFDFRTLKVLHAKYPKTMTAALVEGHDKRSLQQQLDELSFTPTIYSPHHSLVTKSVVEAIHQRNMKIVPWTVNDKAGIDKLKALGVDGVISDYPDLF
ncbi:glycerophosphodiester phosphodiesterase [Pseudoflavitalea rhizosphaerae]|uniref:glycerophosphodiester phosphodiesterase n=1 Tax=Pseudoflavitalea rhizosphaerae TaxID=1884793 RepID=UPI000F8E2EEF|nr:glycerophosphodiester phosphodiesterase [Pseudoflavitalea rhizosphaerae]